MPKVHIDGMPGGDAMNVRFKRRHSGFKDVGLWTWETNPFVGTRELDGLKVLMVVLNNWDLKVDNNKVVRPTKKSGEDTDERISYVGDLGATFGKTGSLAHGLHLPGDPPAGTKDKPSQYAHQDFIDGVRDGTVRFHYKGKDPSTLKGIRIENAKWMGAYSLDSQRNSSPMHSARVDIATQKYPCWFARCRNASESFRTSSED